MKLTLTIESLTYNVDWQEGISLAIPLDFSGVQPNHFEAEFARESVVAAGDFIGDTSLGGSCNVRTLTLTPHCNGTHTESIGHIVSREVAVGELAHELIPATLISVTPEGGLDTTDHYQPPLDTSDSVITRSMLEEQLADVDCHWFCALIIRTLPNSTSKLGQKYDSDFQPPFFSIEAMEYIRELGVKHLLVDFPSIDKMYDEGVLHNHHHYWQVSKEKSIQQLGIYQGMGHTVTEMIYVMDSLKDGHYLLSLQLPHFVTDAAPSRPVVYPLNSE